MLIIKEGAIFYGSYNRNRGPKSQRGIGKPK